MPAMAPLVPDEAGAGLRADLMYLHCPRCRLAIRCRAGHLMPSSCPRCLARAAIVSPLFPSPLNGVELRTADRERVPPMRPPTDDGALFRACRARVRALPDARAGSSSSG